MNTIRSASFLQKTIDEIDSIDSHAIALLSPLSDEEFNRRRAPNKWSVAECLEHLNLVNGMYLPAINAALKNVGNKSSEQSAIKHSLFARFFISSLTPPAKFKMPAPKRVQPQRQKLFTKEELQLQYLGVHEQWRTLTRQLKTDGVDIQKVKVISPVSSLVKLALPAVFDVMVAHERRHLWQAAMTLNNQAEFAKP